MIASILICTRNRAESLRQTLEALANVAVPAEEPCELIVIDNGSTDATAEVAQQAAPANFTTRVICEPVSGQTWARNAGIKAARGRIIVFTDDDVIPSPEWLVRLLEPYQDPAVAAVQGRARLQFDGPPPEWLDTVHRGFLAEVDYGDAPLFPFAKPLTGVNMSFRREVAASVGEYNTMLGPGRSGFWDDTEFSTRLLKAGHRFYYQPAALVSHCISTARLTPAAFRDAAFRNGVSVYIAAHSGAIEMPRHLTWIFMQSTLSKLRWELACALRRSRPVCSQTELFHRMTVGAMWARLQGMRRLTQRYGTSRR